MPPCSCSRSCSPPTSLGKCWHHRGRTKPVWVSAPTNFFARLIAGHPAPLNVGFALVQLALGVGLLIPRLVRPAIVGSVVWAAGIWWFAEGLGGLATGNASVVTGAPGAVLLYGVLALAVWPAIDDRDADPDGVAIAGWFPFAWLILWIGGALLQLLPSQRGTAALHDQLGSADGTPGWLTSLHHLAGTVLSHAGSAPFIALVVVMVLSGSEVRPGDPGGQRPPWLGCRGHHLLGTGSEHRSALLGPGHRPQHRPAHRPDGTRPGRIDPEHPPVHQEGTKYR